MGWSVGYFMGKKRAEENYAKLNRNMGVSRFFGIPFPHNFESSPSLIERFFNNFGTNNSPDPESEEDGSLLDNPFSLFGTRRLQPQLKTHEDDNFVYMEMSLDAFDKKSLSAKVENGMVIIEGNQKEDENGTSMSSHFYQSFPAPFGTDISKVDMSYEDNKLILKFPKLKD